VKKHRLLILVAYLLLISCEDKQYCSEHFLEIEAPNLQYSNGFYRMEYLPQYMQTFTTLKASTGSTNQYQKLAWMSNREILIRDVWTNMVNNVSYTDQYGEAYTVLSAWEQFINDTITVYCGFEDHCGEHYSDSLKVIID
jgi:hypothetical protein